MRENAEQLREFIPATNPLASVEAFEVSPCLELPDYHGGSCVEAFESAAEADEQSGEALGPMFWGVYARLREAAIEAGHNPAVHLKDFDSYGEAIVFVRLLNGDAT